MESQQEIAAPAAEEEPAHANEEEAKATADDAEMPSVPQQPSNTSAGSRKPDDTGEDSGKEGEEEEDCEEGEEEEGDEEYPDDIMDIDLDFEDMELEFQGVLEELSQDPTLARFRMEYDKLHTALQRSHTNERRLMDKCRELQAEIAAHSAEVATALQLASEDKQTIEALKKEVEKAWKMVDLAHEREMEAKETMETLQSEITRLHELSGEGDAAINNQQDAVTELVSAREDLVKERDSLLTEVEGLRDKLDEAIARQTEFEKLKTEANEKLEAMTQDLQVQRGDMMREVRRKERTERDLKNAKADIGAKEAEVKVIQAQLEQSSEQLTTTTAVLKEQRLMNDKVTKENELMAQRYQKLQNDYENQLITVDQLAQESQQKTSELKAKEEEMVTVHQELSRLMRLRDSLQRRQRVAEEQRAAVTADKEAAITTIHTLEHDLDIVKKQMDADKKAMDELRHEKELLKKAILKEQAASLKQSTLLKLHDQAKKSLELEATNMRKAATKQKFVLSQIEKERDKYIGDSATLTQKMVVLVEGAKTKEIEIFDFRKKMAEAESKMKQQESLYEAVRSDRNMYSKKLIESQDEVVEMRRKLSMLNHQIYQLKEESTVREALLVKEINELQRATKEKETLSAELENLRAETNALKSKINELEADHMKLNKVLAEGELERDKQRKEISHVMTERDIVGTQLVRRNDELALLYEKIRIQEGTLSKGERQYGERIRDLKLLKLEVKKLRREKTLLNRSVHNLEDMRREMYHMHRALLKEQSKCKSLENELQNPQNVHRWRRLEGNDPSTYEMILKIQTLQRRLIMKTEEATRKELEIQEKERLYLELKRILQRQPGPEMAEQLMMCQGALRQKTRQMKSLVSELNMYESQMQEYKLDVDRLTDDLKQVKKQYTSQKRSENRLRTRLSEVTSKKTAAASRFPPVISARGPNQLGGGFKLAPISVPDRT